MRDEKETRRLEDLWSGKFGEAYTERNIEAGASRGSFWSRVLRDFPASSILEVGSNVGANLRWLADGRLVVGIDVNHTALVGLRGRIPTVRAVQAAARSLPFADGSFEIVFTAGVLIHQPPASLAGVMREIVRCSARYVLCLEYFSERPVEVAYRDQSGALFKRDFGGLYQSAFPQLRLLRHGSLGRDEGWDDVTFWMLEKAR